MFEIKKDNIEYENKSLRLPKELINNVQKIADKNDISFNKLVIQCIEYAINDMKRVCQVKCVNFHYFFWRSFLTAILHLIIC